MDDAITFELDADGIVRRTAGATRMLLGWPPEQALGRPFTHLVNPADRVRISGEFRASGADAATGHADLPLRFLNDEGRSVWMRADIVAPTQHVSNGSRLVTARPYRRATGASPSTQAVESNRYHALVQGSADIVMVVEPEGTVRFANPAMLRLLGMEPDALVGTQVLDLIHPDDHDAVTAEVVQLLKNPFEPIAFEFRARHVDGTYRWIDGWLQNLLDDPGVAGLLGNGRDVTDRHRAQEALAASEERFRSLASSSPSAIFELDPAARVQFASDWWVEVTGRRLSEIDDVFAVFHPADAERLRARWRTGADGGVDESVRVVRPDGDLRWVDLHTRPVHDADGEVTAHVGTLHDVTEIHHAHAKLEHLATHDPLTGLPNRNMLVENLADAVHAARRTGALLALLFIDLDRFKVVNDSLGHQTGDKVLVEVANRLGDVVRPHDLVARFGGDEFVVLCAPVTGTEQAVALADRIRRDVAGEVDIEGNGLHVSVSVGVVIGSGASVPERLLRDADSAMYEAKSRGRDVAQVFDERMHRAAVERLTVESGLRRGLERNEFRLRYQPIMDLKSMTPRGIEALLRWEHPERGLLEPDRFLGVAEDSGLLGELGSWVLESACRTAAGWPRTDAGDPPRLFVNLAAGQLADPDLLVVVEEVVAATGIDPDRLVLEITEEMLMAGAAATARLLGGVRSLGASIAIDDFGTGYSSLGYLTSLPVDVLKIDRSFVTGLADSPDDRVVTGAIVALAHALGLVAVAEGVELQRQLDVLVELGCDAAQGFYFSAPMPAEQIAAFLGDRRG